MYAFICDDTEQNTICADLYEALPVALGVVEMREVSILLVHGAVQHLLAVAVSLRESKVHYLPHQSLVFRAVESTV